MRGVATSLPLASKFRPIFFSEARLGNCTYLFAANFEFYIFTAFRIYNLQTLQQLAP